MFEFRGKRISKRYTMQIAAKPAVVFPLLCPEREKEWLDGWAYEMIYSQSGFAEQGCAFKTKLLPEGEAYWLMTRHIPPHEAEYVRFVTGKMFVALSFKLAERDGGTAMDMEYTYTAVTEKGNEFVAGQADAGFEMIRKRMENSLGYFINTGKMLKNPV